MTALIRSITQLLVTTPILSTMLPIGTMTLLYNHAKASPTAFVSVPSNLNAGANNLPAVLPIVFRMPIRGESTSSTIGLTVSKNACMMVSQGDMIDLTLEIDVISPMNCPPSFETILTMEDSTPEPPPDSPPWIIWPISEPPSYRPVSGFSFPMTADTIDSNIGCQKLADLSVVADASLSVPVPRI